MPQMTIDDRLSGDGFLHIECSTVFRERCMNEDGRIVETAVKARGARLGRPVLVVLIVSTLAVIVIFSLLYYGSFG
jgi:hypothetical protein